MGRDPWLLMRAPSPKRKDPRSEDRGPWSLKINGFHALFSNSWRAIAR